MIDINILSYKQTWRHPEQNYFAEETGHNRYNMYDNSIFK